MLFLHPFAPRLQRAATVLIGLATLIAGVAGCDSDASTCGAAGATQACVCASGASGAQSCQPDGAWAPCACGSQTTDTSASDTTPSDTSPDTTSVTDTATADPCAAGPCQNGGVCVNLDTTFRCDCVGGFEGTNCETPPLPAFEDTVFRIEWTFFSSSQGDCTGNGCSYYTQLFPFGMSGLASDPQGLEALYRGRRLLGADCVGYILDAPLADNDPRGYPPELLPGADVGQVTGFFRAVGGETIIETRLAYDMSTGRYPFSATSDFLAKPRPDAATILVQNGPALDGAPAGRLGLTSTRFAAVWDIDGFSVSARPIGVSTFFIEFALVGDEATGVVYCAQTQSASDSDATITVPDLKPFATEIGWAHDAAGPDGSAPDKARMACGATEISDPALGGRYGLVGQAIQGPSFIFDQSGTYNNCTFATP